MKPVLQALLIADHVYEDKTGKKVIAGTFNRLWFKTGGMEPQKIEKDGETRHVLQSVLQTGSPYAYISLTDCRGTFECVLRYVYLDEDQALFECPFEVTCDDPLLTIEVVLPMPKLPVVKAGIYALELLCGDEPLGSHRITVEEMKGEDDDSD